MSMSGVRTLVLNTNYMPESVFPVLSTVSGEEAMQSIVRNAFVSVLDYPKLIKTSSRHELYWPSVIMPVRSHKRSRSNSNSTRLTRGSLFYRDHGYCQYCGTDLSLEREADNVMTIDHYHPRSLGGRHAWDNVVASCKECNRRKADQLPGKKWKPKQQPFVPTFYQILEERRKYPLQVADPEWMMFLPQWIGPVTVTNHAASRVANSNYETYGITPDAKLDEVVADNV